MKDRKGSWMKTACLGAAIVVGLWPLVRSLQTPFEAPAAWAIIPACIACAIALTRLGAFLGAFEVDPKLDGPSIRQVRFAGLWLFVAAVCLVTGLGVGVAMGLNLRNPAVIGLAALFLFVLGWIFIGFSHVLRRSLEIQNDWEGFI